MAGGVKSWTFRRAALQEGGSNDPRRLEPREPWRRVGQRRNELPDGDPQRERPDEPHDQQRRLTRSQSA